MFLNYGLRRTKTGLKVPECLKSEFILLMLGQELVDYLITLHQTIVVALHHSGRTGLIYSVFCLEGLL